MYLHMKFLNNLDIPMIDKAVKNDLDKPLQLQEILDSIQKMQSGKTPAPDSYPFGIKKKKFSSTYSHSICNNHLFPAARLYHTFRRWESWSC